VSNKRIALQGFRAEDHAVDEVAMPTDEDHAVDEVAPTSIERFRRDTLNVTPRIQRMVALVKRAPRVM
jgi:hypothetical protein